MKSELRQKQVDPLRLVHVIIPGDNVVGESVGWEGEFMKVKNPKRLIRQQGMVPGKGLVVSISMVDWDMVDDGVVHVKPIAYVLVSEMSEETQGRYLGIYLGYLEDRKIQRAQQAGIAIPTMQQARSVLAGDVRQAG
jgi:hypothetical protein